MLLLALAFLSGCGSVDYRLPGHSAAARTAPLTLRPDEQVHALDRPHSLPGTRFWLSLAAEDPSVVQVVFPSGRDYLGPVYLRGASPGTTTVHYVNVVHDFQLPENLTGPAALAAEEALLARTPDLPEGTPMVIRRAALLRQHSLASFTVTVSAP